MKYILAFAGSNSRNSINKQLVTYASGLIEDVKVSILDLNDFELPVFSVDLEKDHGIPENAYKFLEKIKSTNGIILSLAEHNGAYTTAFKNLFDWMSRAEQKTFMNKPMLLMATSPGARGGASVLAIAKDRFPRHDAQIIADFSLPSFSANFLEGKIVNDELDRELKQKVEQFKKNLIIMEIQHEDNGKKGKFYIEVDGKQEAEMTYTYAGPQKIIIDHTEVGEKLKGQGIGYKLVEASVDFMRKNNIVVIPLCPFAAAVFKKKHEYSDRLD
jgi:NAD(P)H-dependent FMN reductase